MNSNFFHIKHVFTYYFIFVSCFYFSHKTIASCGADKIDSLLLLIHKAETDIDKINIFNEIAFQLAISNTDSAIYYANKSLNLSEKHLKSNEKDKPKFQSSKSTSFHNLGVIYYYMCNYENALNYYFKSLELRNKLVKEHPQNINYKNDLADSYNNIGIIYKQKGEYEKTLEYYFKVLNIYEEINKSKNGEFSSKTGLGAAYNNLGLMYHTLGNYSKALQYHLKSLRIKEEIGDKSGIAYSYNNIGVLYYSQRNFKQALEFYFLSLKIRVEKNDKKGMAASYNNIGMVYSDLGANKKALEYFVLSVKIKEELSDKKSVAITYSNIASIYYDMGEKKENLNFAPKYFTSALYYFKEVLKMDVENDDKHGMASTCLNIGSVFTRLNRFEESLHYLHRGLKLAKELGEKEIIKSAYLGLSELSDKTGNYKKAFEYLQHYSLIKDSLLNVENSKLITEMSARYESEKKEKQIILLEKNKGKQEEESKRQQLFILIIVAIAASVTIIAIIIFRSLQITRKQKNIIETQKTLVDEKNIILNQQNEEISSQRDEIEIQRDLVTQQKEHIEEIYKEVSDSIFYAKRIQQAVLPDLEILLTVGNQSEDRRQKTEVASDFRLPTSDYFILFKPKHIVSGDFYWATLVNESLIVTVADCTGHGIPGAFMSMLGISFLNEIVRKKEITKASDVLNHLRESIIEALQQKGQSGEQQDGMDIAFCAINLKTLEMQFAGANNPLWIVRKLKVESYKVESYKVEEQTLQTLQTFELYELRGDKQPIGIYENMKPFTNNIYQLEKDDCIYLMSDGYEDQFGGPNHKKFLSKNLKQLLLVNCQLSMEKQKEILGTELTEWMGNNEQIDDITVIGIRI